MGDLPTAWYHFAGVAGSGMSALAQFHAWKGGRATGSDRALDRLSVSASEGRVEQPSTSPGAHGFDPGSECGVAAIRRHLETLGVEITPQDGSALKPGCDALIVSTAVEATVPDVQAARRHGIPIWHRSELLARYVRDHRSIAVTGTSGKSTVTAMIFEILRGAGRDPSVITGGDLLLLQDEGYLGNAWAGATDWLVIEADESDGSLIRYEPWTGVLLNLQRDHKEPEELAEIFTVFRSRTRGPWIMGEDANLAPFRVARRVTDRSLIGPGDPVRASHDPSAPAPRPSDDPPNLTFGFEPTSSVRADHVELERDKIRFTVVSIGGKAESVRFDLPLVGLHNVRNALAAIAASHACGVPLPEMAGPLSRFRGVARRFQVVGHARGIEIIDDFAHNPAKIEASLSAARPRGERILAVYQPHGFGPTRFLHHDLVEAFAAHLRPTDRLYMPEIFYAGGTATKDISSRDLIEEITARGIPATFAERREELVNLITAEARTGDTILVMGARDPSLTGFCRHLLGRIAS